MERDTDTIDKTIGNISIIMFGSIFFLLLSRFSDHHKEQAEAKRQHDEQIAKADKDRKEQLKHDWRISIFSAVFGLISGLVIEHFLDILALFFSP